MPRLLFAAIAIILSSACFADAYKCKTPDGKTIISDTGCFGNSRTEAVRQNEVITPWQQYQAQQEVERQRRYVAEREAENAAWLRQHNAMVRQQQAIDLAESRQQARKELADAEQRRINDCVSKVNRTPMSEKRRQIMHSVCSGTPIQEADPVVRAAPSSPEQLPSYITGCNGNYCRDNNGTGYTTKPGKIVRSDGRRCYTQGTALYCD